MWIVLLEWGGATPPGSYYRRLHKIGLRVRGESDRSVLTRRKNDPSSVVFQEGAIVVSSPSLAMTIASLAIDFANEHGLKPPTVQVGELSLKFRGGISDEDRDVLDRIAGAFGKRGRPDPEDDWVVVCYECLTTQAVRARAVVNCPACAATRVKIRRGKPNNLKDPGGSLLAAWQRTRFGLNGTWEPPTRSTKEAPALKEITIDNHTERTTIGSLQQSGIERTLASLSRREAFEVLDAILTARGHWPKEERLAARAKAAIAYVQSGGSLGAILLNEPDVPDLLSAAGPL